MDLRAVLLFCCAFSSSFSSTPTPTPLIDESQTDVTYTPHPSPEPTQFEPPTESVTTRLQHFEETLTRIQDQLTSVAQLNQALTAVQNQLTLLAQLNASVSLLSGQIEQVAQDSLATDLEFQNVPEKPRENVTQVVIETAAGCGVKLSEMDIVLAERVGVRGKRAPRRIAVRLRSRLLRDHIIKQAGLTLVAKGSELSPLRAVERLTAPRKRLLRLARAACKAHGWQYAGSRRGRIFVGRSADTPPQWITTEEDLRTIFANEPTLMPQDTNNI